MTRPSPAAPPVRPDTVDCPTCGQAVELRSQFCGACGTRIRVRAKRPDGGPSPRSALDRAISTAVGRIRTPVGGVARARVRLAGALVAAGRLTDAEAECSRGLADTEEAGTRADLCAVRSLVRRRIGKDDEAALDAWEVVVLRGGPAARLPALAALAPAGSESARGLSTTMLGLLPRDDRRPDVVVARFLLLAGLGNLADAAAELAAAPPGLANAPLGLDVAGQERRWTAAFGEAVGPALGALLRAAIGDGDGAAHLAVAALARDLTVEGPGLVAPLLRIRARQLAAAGERMAAAAMHLDAALEAAGANRFADAVGDLEECLKLDPENRSALWHITDYRQYLAGRGEDPDLDAVALARREWHSAAAAGPPDQSLAWAYLTLANIVELSSTHAQRELAWEAMRATLCGLLLDSALPGGWANLSRQLRMLGERDLAATVRAIGQEAAGGEELGVAVDETLASYMEDPDQLEHAIDEWQRLGPASPLQDLLRGVARLRAGDGEGALVALEAARAVDPPDARLVTQARGIAAVLTGDLAGGRALLVEVADAVRPSVERFPGSWQRAMADLVSLVGNPAEGEELARRWAAQAAETTDHPADVHATLLRAAVGRGDRPAALDELAEVFGHAPLRATLVDLEMDLRLVAELRPECRDLAATTLARLASSPRPPAAPGRRLGYGEALARVAEIRGMSAGGMGDLPCRALGAVLLRQAGRREEAQAELRSLTQAPAVASAAEIASAEIAIGELAARLVLGPRTEILTDMVTAARVLDPADPWRRLTPHLTTPLRSVDDGWAVIAVLGARAAESADDATGIDAAVHAVRREIEVRIDAAAPTTLEPPGPVLVLELGNGLVPPDARDHWVDWALFTEYIPEVRDRVEATTGLRPPGVRVRGGSGMAPFAYRVLVDDVPVAPDEELPDSERSWAEPIMPAAHGAGTSPSLSSLAAGLEAQIRRAQARLVGLDDIAALLGSWCDAEDVAPETRGQLETPAGLMRAAALARTLLDDRVPLRAGAILPVLEKLGAHSREWAVEQVRAASVGELRERLDPQRSVVVDADLAAAAAGLAGPVDDGLVETRVNQLVDRVGEMDGAPQLVVTDPRARAAVRRLLRPRLPDAEVFTLQEAGFGGRSDRSDPEVRG